MRQLAGFHYNFYDTPEELHRAYSNGDLIGARCDPEGFASFTATLPFKTFYDAAPNLIGAGEGKLSLPFKAVLELDPTAYEERQTTGDCVSHATRNACQLRYSSEIRLLGEREKLPARFATEGIYGCRGHGGQGMACSQAARFVTNGGGILLRQKYDFADLSKYNGSIGARWGGTGLPPAVVAEAKKHVLKTAVQIRTTAEARDAIASFRGLACCSGYGFSGTRNEDGIAKRAGGWSHAMAWTACDDTPATRTKYGGMLFLVQNSWGAWNSGPTKNDQPPGSFWIVEKDAQGMLNQDGTFIYSDVDGWPDLSSPKKHHFILG